MRKLAYIGSLIVVALMFSASAISQTKNSATQTVLFAVNRSAQPALNVLTSYQNLNTSLKENIALENQLKQQSSKVTVSTSNSFSSNTHIDLLSVIEKRKLIATDKTQLILTITE